MYSPLHHPDTHSFFMEPKGAKEPEVGAVTKSNTSIVKRDQNT